MNLPTRPYDHDTTYWTAFQYVTGELDASGHAEFEARLARDQTARETLAEVVEWSLAASCVREESEPSTYRQPQVYADGDSARSALTLPLPARRGRVGITAVWQPLRILGGIAAGVLVAGYGVWGWGFRHQGAAVRDDARSSDPTAASKSGPGDADAPMSDDASGASQIALAWVDLRQAPDESELLAVNTLGTTDELGVQNGVVGAETDLGNDAFPPYPPEDAGGSEEAAPSQEDNLALERSWLLEMAITAAGGNSVIP